MTKVCLLSRGLLWGWVDEGLGLSMPGSANDSTAWLEWGRCPCWTWMRCLTYVCCPTWMVTRWTMLSGWSSAYINALSGLCVKWKMCRTVKHYVMQCTGWTGQVCCIWFEQGTLCPTWIVRNALVRRGLSRIGPSHPVPPDQFLSGVSSFDNSGILYYCVFIAIWSYM